MIGIVWATEPPFPAKQLGKIVPHAGQLVYVFDGAAIYNRLQAIGVSETVLVYMLQNDVQAIHYTIAGRNYVTSRDEVIEYGFRDSVPGTRKGYLYLGLKRWSIQPSMSYPWLSAKQRVDLPWRIDAPELADWKARIVAARPVPAMQIGLWA